MLVQEQLKLDVSSPRGWASPTSLARGSNKLEHCPDRPGESTSSAKSNSIVNDLQIKARVLISSCILMLFHISGSHIAASEGCLSQLRFSSAAAAALLLCSSTCHCNQSWALTSTAVIGFKPHKQANEILLHQNDNTSSQTFLRRFSHVCGHLTHYIYYS